MAILSRTKNLISSRLKSLTRFQRCNHTLDEKGFQAALYSEMAPPSLLPKVDVSNWKKIPARKFGIADSMIPYPSWIVLNTLRRAGFEAYLVGGCVRDLVLKRIPKDFDVITTANLKQIKKKFNRAEIIGRRFPICMVHIKGSIIEVSSFETVSEQNKDKEKTLSSLIPNKCNEKDLIRWKNSMHRDFTINSLFFDPFTFNIYDYNNGIADLKYLKLRTLIPAHVSFREDCARILRGLRIAARLGLSLSKDTVSAIHDLSASIKDLDKFRLMLELNYMLSYGAAESSIWLLYRFNLLHILLPIQAAYINQQRSAKNSMMLMSNLEILLDCLEILTGVYTDNLSGKKLFFNLDKLVSCGHPTDSKLWVGLLMFHMALVNNPQDAIVVWTFASVLYHGNWEEGVEFAREHAKVEVKFVPEISGLAETKSDEDLAKDVAQFASLVQDSAYALSETHSLLESMSRYPFSPCSGLVFLPRKIAKGAAKIFDMMVEDIKSYIQERWRDNPEINYRSLGKGEPFETRYVLGKIILETLNAGPIGVETEIASGEKDVLYEKEIERILANDQPPQKKDKMRAPSLLSPEANQRMPKKQKLVDSNQNPSELYAAIEKQEAAKEQQKLVECEINSMLGSIRGKEKSHSLNQERTKIKEEEIGNHDEKKKAKNMQAVKLKHHILPNAASTKEQKVVRKPNSSQDEMVEQEKVLGKEGCEEVVKEKAEIHKDNAANGRSSVASLASLFK